MTTAMRMDDVQWPKALNNVITKRWSQLKNTLVMKDFVDHLIQRRVVTLDYWMGLKSKPISESERTEDFLSLVLKFDQQKFNHFLEALLMIDREDLVRQLMKCKEVKQLSGKNRGSEKQISKPHQKKTPEKARATMKVGQTDCDQLPTTMVPEPIVNQKPANRGDGHNGSLESNKPKKGVNISKDAVTKHPPFISKQSEPHGLSRMPGIKSETSRQTGLQLNNSESNYPKTKSESPTSNKQNSVRVTGEEKSREASADKKQSKSRDIQMVTNSNKEHKPDSYKSGNELNERDLRVVPENRNRSNNDDIGTQIKTKELQKKEEQLKNKETELEQKELRLQEQEKILKQKETELFTRENSLLTSTTGISEIGSLAATRQYQIAKFDDNSYPPTTTTTQSTDIFAEVRERLDVLKKEQEIESEHTTSFGFNKEDFVKTEEFQAIQQEVEELRQEIATDRSERENVQKKVEDLKQEIESLHSTIKTLKIEKQTDKTQLDREVDRLKNELKNSKLSYNDAIAKIRSELKNKDNECQKLKVDIENNKKDHDELDRRVVSLENERHKLELEILKYEKDLSDLKSVLEDKEAQLLDLRKALEDTESEKDDLVEEVSGLKTEVARLKVERKRLEQEKKTLLGRCVKPGWNASTSRNTTFKK